MKLVHNVKEAALVVEVRAVDTVVVMVAGAAADAVAMAEGVVVGAAVADVGETAAVIAEVTAEAEETANQDFA